LPIWPPINDREHGVLFYEDDPFLMDTEAGFVGSALAAHQHGVIVVTPRQRAGVDIRLASLGIAAACIDGLYRAIDARQMLGRIMAGPRPAADPFGALLHKMLAGVTDDRPARIFGEMVALLVGDGMPEAALALEDLWNRQVGSRPFRGDRENSRWGIGLRLYLCRQIAELHGGELTAAWPSDGGTRVAVRLPG
jgi:hypothetical protein